jgi:hypothetical protein
MSGRAGRVGGASNAGLPFEGVPVSGLRPRLWPGMHTAGLLGTVLVVCAVRTRSASGSGRAVRSAVMGRNMCGRPWTRLALKLAQMIG